MYLGVDGGGTKTALCLLDRDGRVAAQAQAPSCYYFAEGIDLVGRVLREGIDEVCERASITSADIRYAFFGLPTYGEVSSDLPTLDAIPGEVLGHGRYACDNDTVCGWAGSLGGVDGINVVSGTGSITYGERAGRGVRVGGWGELFGDEGSAYWISIKGLNAFSRMCDGRLPVGPLYEALRAHLELGSDLDLVDIVLNRWQGRRSEIAALSQVVAREAENGDECAAQILSEAAGELAGLVDTSRRLLDFGPREKVPVSYSGGVFNALSIVEGFEAALGDLHDGYEMREPLYSPVIGAAIYAAKLAGEPLDSEKLGRLEATQQESSTRDTGE
jgi:N-acetylglucosamine kinase-like BadF-type ATPase